MGSRLTPTILEVRITDFGAAFSASAVMFGAPLPGEQTTTAWFRAPEAIMGETVTHKIDCWAFGCHLVALFFGRPQFVKYCADKSVDQRVLQNSQDYPFFGANKPGGMMVDSAVAFIGQIAAFGSPPLMSTRRGSSWPLADKLHHLLKYARPSTAAPFLEHQSDAASLVGVRFIC